MTTAIEWRIFDIGLKGQMYHDMIVDGLRVPNCWIVEYDLAGQGRVYQFVQTIDFRTSESREPMRGTFDEAAADAAMFFANRELEKHG